MFDPATGGAVAKEIGNVDKIIKNLIGFDFLVKDALAQRSLRTVIDRIESIYFSKQTYLRLLERLAAHQGIGPNEYQEVTNRLMNSQAEVTAALDNIQQTMDRHAIRFDEGFLDLVGLLVDVKTRVRESLWELMNYLQSQNFSKAAADEVATKAANLVSEIKLLNESLKEARRTISRVAAGQ
jgi:hypothetical protein